MPRERETPEDEAVRVMDPENRGVNLLTADADALWHWWNRESRYDHPNATLFSVFRDTVAEQSRASERAAVVRIVEGVKFPHAVGCNVGCANGSSPFCAMWCDAEKYQAARATILAALRAAPTTPET